MDPYMIPTKIDGILEFQHLNQNNFSQIGWELKSPNNDVQLTWHTKRTNLGPIAIDLTYDVISWH